MFTSFKSIYVDPIPPKDLLLGDILGLFGAPTHTSTLGPNEVYVYKNCKTGGAGVSVLGLGHTGMTERCNSLSVTIDKGSGVVQSYNYQKMFDAD